MSGLQRIGPHETQTLLKLQQNVISLSKRLSIANCIFSLVLIYLMHLGFLKIFGEAYGLHHSLNS